MKICKHIFIAIISVTCFSSFLFAQVEPVKTSEEPTGTAITAMGKGTMIHELDQQGARVIAEKQAKVEALKNLAEKVYAAKIATGMIRDLTAQDAALKEDIDNSIKTAEVTDIMYLPDGSVEVVVSLNLDAILKKLEQYKR